ncbi:hypothetical protein C2S53_015282 [Perilla frutescens var. hirtella]|uniref:Myb/SANT-like domain-containing protein n=1 Tax=Perilla frutescens var. hirtella TaxID=608512 RepID=A0AAD4J5L2_PERFH|nr:hypothetical protein C2S53_015282 [Perilla frutescens var. hirtella]
MDSQSQDSRGRGKNKRKWRHDEDAKLVEALLDMVNLGTYKADNGFKPGYLAFIEEKLQVSLPNSGVKAKPHIESRIKTLKRDFNIVYDMLNGSNTSGFGYDELKKCITAESDVWDAYLQSHPTHSTWRNKPFPFYEDLLIIFGKDRATGSNAEGPADMMEDIQRQGNNNSEENNEDAIEDLDASFSFSPLHSPRNEGVQHQKKKRKIASYDSQLMTIEIKEASSAIASEIAKASQIFGKTMGVDAEISEKRRKIHAEIKKIPNLTVAEVIKVVSHIASHPELIDVFFSMDEESREQLVRAILNGEI